MIHGPIPEESGLLTLRCPVCSVDNSKEIQLSALKEDREASSRSILTDIPISTPQTLMKRLK